MINFEKDRYFNCIWFVSGEKVNWLCAIFRDKEGPWHVIYRFFYYKENGRDHEDDHKSWYEATAPREREEAEMEASMDKLASVVLAKFSIDAGREADFWKVELHSDDDEANATEFAKQSFVHPRRLNELTGRGEPAGEA